MPFITAFMLWGSLAAAIPVAIHLFFRSRYRTVPWAAMKFLLTSVEQTSRRLKFQEYLLLLARMSVLVFLAIALARPVNVSLLGAVIFVAGILLAIVTLTWALAPLWQLTASRAVNWVLYGISQIVLVGLCALLGMLFYFVGQEGSSARARGEGDAVDAVFVFDMSFSMGADDGARTRLQRAQAEALKIIDELPPHSTVQIVTCAGKAKELVGPHPAANLEKARSIVKDLELTHLATDLSVGVLEAQDVLTLGQAANKELYLFSDMQKSGFDQQAGALKKTLVEIKEKAVVHFVRCGDNKRTLKNAAIVGITPQTGVPRPKERTGFAVLVRNTGSETIDNLTVSLLVDGDPKLGEQQTIPKLKGNDTYAVTLSGELKEAGLRVLTAKLKADDLDGDNRYDQVILVRRQVNILVVDGKANDKDPEKASSYYLMHSLLPVKESDRATYKYNPRMMPARLATAAALKDQDICVLANCALNAKPGVEQLPTPFVGALTSFVRKGHGLVIFSGDNVKPDAYNVTLGNLGLLPMPLKPAVKAADKKPLFVDRQSFRFGPPAYWIFKDDEKYYKDFDKVEVWQHLGLDESALRAQQDKADSNDQENPLSVILRLNSGQPLVVAKKVDAGEVIFAATAAHDEGLDAKTFNPNWTDLGTAPEFIPFMDVTVNHLLHSQTQNYNLTAGQTLSWYPTQKQDHSYFLVHPDGKRVDRLGVPAKLGQRLVVTANDLPRAGVYRMASLPRDVETTKTIDPAEAVKTGTPIAVIPDLTESADLSTLNNAQIKERLGFEPIHIVAGQPESTASSADRTNREWTVWALLAVLGLVLGEVALAWWCGRAW